MFLGYKLNFNEKNLKVNHFYKSLFNIHIVRFAYPMSSDFKAFPLCLNDSSKSLFVWLV